MPSSRQVVTSVPKPSNDLCSFRQALLEGGADPEYGNPNAMQCVAMFKQEETWKAKFDAAPGRGKAKEPAQGPSL